MPDPARFRTVIDQIAPPWLQRQWGERFLYALGLMLDAQSEAAREGVAARCPGAPDAPPDALPYIGADRVILRGRLESDASYGGRLTTSFDAWKRAGSSEAVMRQAQAVFLPVTTVRAQVVINVVLPGNLRRWATIDTYGGAITYHDGDADAWDWDGNVALWARAWLVLNLTDAIWPRLTSYTDLVASGAKYGDPTWAWGLAVPWQEAQAVRRIVSSWRAAHSRYECIVLSYDPTWPDPSASPGPTYPDGTWASVIPRNPDALYMAAVDQ